MAKASNAELVAEIEALRQSLQTERRERQRLQAELEQCHTSLAEALEQQTATSEILRVISSSPTDLQPVFDAIAASATRLCDALHSLVFQFDGETITLAAHHGSSPVSLEVIRSAYPAPPGRQSVAAQAILERRVIAIADAQSGTAYPHVAERARAIGYRSILSVPMLRGDAAIGAINVVRVEAIPFTDKQIELLKTFADQAVIAIENVRLFTELQARNRDLTQALEQQTATAEVLRVIGSSPTDAQPVFEAIVSSARRLLSGFGGAVYRVAGDEIHLAAYISTNPSGDAALRSSFPRPLAVFSPPGEAIRRRAPVVVTDIKTDGWIPDDIRELIRKRGDQSGVWVPMMRDGVALGAIGVTRGEPGSFGDEQIELLKTFADQAVIAIENVRLFTELQEKNRDLTTALDQQTATSEILRVISSSPTDVQPVFDTIAERAMRLCGAAYGTVHMFAGELIHLNALANVDPEGTDALT